MVSYIVTRLLQTVLVLLLMTAVIFMLARLGGDPVERLLSDTATEQDRIELTVMLGLDKPLPEQYWIWLKSVSHGDFGKSFLKSIPVIDYIKVCAPNTLRLSLYSMILALLFGLPLGILAGVMKGKPLDILARSIAIFGQSAPVFWLGLVLMYFFAIKWPIFPIVGWMSGLYGAFLPSITLCFTMLPGVMRLTRSAMIEALDSGYVTFARIKGLSEVKVIFKHALKNALIPSVTFGGMYFSILLSGVVVVEVVFAWPGIGLLTFKAATGGDYPVLQGAVFLVAVTTILTNLIVDILYVYIDPRIRYWKVE
jgi:peptide/nickel transport system permease protein